MGSLIDRPGDEELILLRVVADGYEQGGTWPVWQWVAREVRDRTGGSDPRELLRGLPQWQHNYRPAYATDSGSLEPGGPGHHIALTVVGMFHAANSAVYELMNCVVTAVAGAAEIQAEARPPSPTEAVPVKVTSSDLVGLVVDRAGLTVEPSRLLACLRWEPWVWGGLTEQGGAADWYWDLDVALLQSFVGIKSAASYLNRMESLVAYPEFSIAEIDLPANALAEAFDHLNLAWRLATGKSLLHLRQCMSVTTLAEPVSSAKEYQAACVALADVLDCISLDGQGKSLGRLTQHLEDVLTDPSRAVQGVGTLRNIAALRNGAVHSGGDAAAKADRARVALGMDRFGTDWKAAWDHVRVITVEGLRTIREEVTTLIAD